jgi:hypothetical protein
MPYCQHTAASLAKIMIFSETSKVALRFYQFFNTMVMGRKRKGSLFDMKSKP